MTARTHDAFAFAALITVAAYYPPSTLNLTTAVTAIVANIVGCLIPDMDQASNRLWDLLPAGDHMGRIFRRVFLKHRTLSHSFLGMFIIYTLLINILPKLLNPNFVDINIVTAAMMIGYMSHLIADSLTKDGLPLFWPLKWDVGFPPFSFLRITTGSWMENFVALPAVAGYVFWFIGSHQEVFLQIIKSISA
jgi:inner membrane protein